MDLLIVRRFKVYERPADHWHEVNGVEALAKLIRRQVSDIPTIRLYRVTFDEFVVVELDAKKD